jgi:hypothetical protein
MESFDIFDTENNTYYDEPQEYYNFNVFSDTNLMNVSDCWNSAIHPK